MILPLLLALVQCPDGTPPPCRGSAPAVRAAGPDTTRIAIFPFRVTAADTMLGEGFAELLSSEFPGGRGPRAVHMSNVIRAWRNAGGGVRAPLTQPVAARTARQVGAGLYIDGSVVGLGNRLTVTALVVSAVDGQVRRAEPIRGSADSLDVLLSRVAATLVAWAWEALGEPRKAFYAVRVRPWGITLLFTEPLLAREEGRLALAAGDTTAALAAYRRFLGMRRDPEPVLVPQRDSIQAILNRLTRR